jgi:MFS family permease
MKNQNIQGNAKSVLAACVLFNLSLGVLYAWSVLKSDFMRPVSEGGWGWTSSQAGLPYTIAIACFAVTMMIAGRIQDKIGPRWVLTAGGILCGLGLILCSFIGNSPVGIAVCFGVVAGMGGGAGYGCATPPALKWFHPSKKGLISGMVVGGFGLAAMYYAPLTTMLLNNFGTERAMLMIGVGILVLTTFFAQFVKNPPIGYTPVVPANFNPPAQTAAKKSNTGDYTWREMMKTKLFWMVFIMFVASASVGLMVIGNVTNIAKTQIGITDGGVLAMMVSLLAFVNTFGRVLGGMMSDKVGRINALFVVLILQVINMVGFLFYGSIGTLVIGIILVGFCFGTLLSVFPSLTADQYGLKNFGQNYGIMFLAWGLAGVLAPMLASYFFDLNGNFYTTYTICAVMTGVMVVVNFLVKKDIEARSR